MRLPVGNDPVPLAQSQQSPEVAAILNRCTVDEPAIELGVPMEDDEPSPPRLLAVGCRPMLDRHGLVAGATTRKDEALQNGAASRSLRSLRGQGSWLPLARR
jgi:hypothetical protein